MMSGHGTVETAVEATRLGALDYVEKPLSLAKLLRTVRSALEEGGRRQQAARTLVPPLIAPVGPQPPDARAARAGEAACAARGAGADRSGEPGTGREAFARYIHSLGPRAGGPFVTAVAGALTGENAEAMLYGSESGGVVRKGLIEQAERGVLFINELGDLAPARAAAAVRGARRRQLPACRGDARRSDSTRA